MAGSQVIRELLVSVGVKVDGDGFAKFDAGISQVRDGLGTLLGMAGAVAAAAAGVGAALAYQADATAREAVEQERLAKALGTTSQELGALNYAAQEFGADSNDISDLFTTLADRAEDAKGGMQSFIDDFALAGIAVDDLKGKDPAGLVNLFADSIAGIEDPTKRAAVAVRILGDDAGRKLLPMLMQGSAGLKRYQQEAIATGAVLDQNAVAASERYIEVTRKLGVQVKAVRNTIGAALIPIMTELATEVLGVTETFARWVRSGVDRYGKRITRAFDDMRDAIKRHSVQIVAALGAITGAMLVLAAAGAATAGILAIVGIVGGLASALSSVAAGLAFLGGGSLLLGVAIILGAITSAVLILTAPLLVLGGLLVATGLAFDDLMTYLSGGTSVIGEFVAAWDGTDTVFGQMIETGRALGDVLSSVGELVGTIGGKMGDVLGPHLTRTAEAAGRVLEVFKMLASGTLSTVANLIGGALTNNLLTMETILKGIASALDSISSGFASIDATALPSIGALGSAGQMVAAGARSLTVQQAIAVNGAQSPQAVGAAVAGAADNAYRGAMQWLNGGVQ